MSITESRLLQLALERLESQKRDLDAEIAELKTRQGYGQVKHRGRPRKVASIESEVSNFGATVEPKKRMSEEHRLAISKAMKERWANRSRGTNNGHAIDPEKTKPRLIKANRQAAQV